MLPLALSCRTRLALPRAPVTLRVRLVATSTPDKKDDKKKKWSMKDLMKPENFIIARESQWKVVFDTFILIVIGYSCFATVLYIAFEIQHNDVSDFIDTAVMITFTLDFIFNFF